MSKVNERRPPWKFQRLLIQRTGEVQKFILLSKAAASIPVSTPLADEDHQYCGLRPRSVRSVTDSCVVQSGCVQNDPETREAAPSRRSIGERLFIKGHL